MRRRLSGSGRGAWSGLLVAMIAGPLTAGFAAAQPVAFDVNVFDCESIRRSGERLELDRTASEGPETTVFSCVGRSCLNRLEIEKPDGTRSVIFRHVYLPRDRMEYVSTWALWRAGDVAPAIHRSTVDRLLDCRRLAADPEVWTMDLGTARDAGEEIRAVIPTDTRPSYFLAPEPYLGDWSAARAIGFEKRSSGGSYVPAYSYDKHYVYVDGDVVLRNGGLRATHAIAEDHDGEWRGFAVPLDGDGWVLSGGANSLAEVLAHVTGFEIRAEYADGNRDTAIRNVTVE